MSFAVLNKRAFLRSIAAVAGLGVAWPVRAGGEASAERRIGLAAGRALPPQIVSELAEEGRACRMQSRARILELAAADYRTGRTVVVNRVLLSRTEVAKALDAVRSA